MIKFLKAFIALLIFFIAPKAEAQKQVRIYIEKYKGLAQLNMKEHDIPASVILGISIVESGAGESAVCKLLKNYFGIVGKNKNSKQKLGYQSMYKEYPSDTASFNHFCMVVKKKDLYKKLKGNKDYKEWINALNKAGYAAAKEKWVNKIIATIIHFNLYKLDS